MLYYLQWRIFTKNLKIHHNLPQVCWFGLPYPFLDLFQWSRSWQLRPSNSFRLFYLHKTFDDDKNLKNLASVMGSAVCSPCCGRTPTAIVVPVEAERFWLKTFQWNFLKAFQRKSFTETLPSECPGISLDPYGRAVYIMYIHIV